MALSSEKVMDEPNNRSGEDFVLESLFELWLDRDPVCDESIRQLYRELGACTAGLPVPQRDRVSNIIAELCTAYSHCAFLDGARTVGAIIRQILFEK